MAQDETPISNWAPIVGRWKETAQTINYRGPDERGKHPYGLCVSNVELEEGIVKASVALSGNTSGRILLGFRSESEPYISAGLAGYTFAYTITLWEPDRGWLGVANTGHEVNLKPGKWYEIEARLEGKRVTLIVNKVRVIEHNLSQPLARGQVGLFAWGTAPVVFRNVTAGEGLPSANATEPTQGILQRIPPAAWLGAAATLLAALIGLAQC